VYNIIALGKPEFLLGFRLAGIRTIEAVENPREQFEELSEQEEIGIIITDDQTIESVSENYREKLETLVKPVVVVLSLDAASQDGLRKKIKKSIGVDLWN
jgi:vacuolar-type H+-ATPase subunit F/Vma7